MSGPALLPALRVGLRESLTSVMHEARQETPTAVGRQTIGSNIRPISTGHSEKDVNCGLPLPHHRHRRPVKLSGMPGEETAAAKGGASSLVSAATLLHMQYQELVALTDTGSQATTLASPQRDLIAATLDLSFMTPLLATIQACSAEDLPLVPLSPGSRASSPPLGWLPQQHSSPPVRHGSAAAVTASATADTTITNRSPRPVRARRRVFGDAGLPPPLLRGALGSQPSLSLAPQPETSAPPQRRRDRVRAASAAAAPQSAGLGAGQARTVHRVLHWLALLEPVP